jgi:hypothetical protein
MQNGARHAIHSLLSTVWVWVCVGVCVCMYVYVYLCMCMCICVYICMYAYVCLFVCLYVCTYVCIYVCVGAKNISPCVRWGKARFAPAVLTQESRHVCTRYGIYHSEK